MKQAIFTLFAFAASLSAQVQIVGPLGGSSGSGGSGTISNGAGNDIPCYSALNTIAPCATGVFTYSAGTVQIGAAGSATPIIFEGATADAFEGTVTVADFTADRVIRIPDADSVMVQGGACPAGDFVSAIDATTGARTCGTPAGGGGAVTVLDSGFDSGTPCTASACNIDTYVIPGGTLAIGDILEVEAVFQKTGTNGTARMGIMWVNASNEIGSCGVTSGAAAYTTLPHSGRLMVTGATEQRYVARHYTGPTAENVCAGTVSGTISGDITISFRAITMNASDSIALSWYEVRRIRP